MQSPRKSKASKRKALLSPVDFKGRLQDYVKAIKEADKEIAEAKKSKDKKVVKEGREFTAKSLGKIKTQTLKELLKLSAEYQRTFRRARAPRAGNANGGFFQPLGAGPELIAFFSQADLGTTGGRDGSGQRLQSVLSFLNPGTPYVSRSILTSLFALYAKRHNLSSFARDNQGKSLEQQNRQLLSVDQLMNTTLARLIEAERADSAAKLAAANAVDGQRKPAVMPKSGKVRKFNREDGTLIWNDHYHLFDPQNFSYSYLQAIFNKGVESTESLAARLGVAKDALLVKPNEVAREYMNQVDAAAEAGTLGTAGNGFGDIATRLGGGQGLQLRAALDDAHARVAAASATYDVERKAKARPKAKKAQ